MAFIPIKRLPEFWQTPRLCSEKNMIKQFLIKAGRKLKRLSGSGEKKKKSTSLPDQEPLHSTEPQHTSSGKTVQAVQSAAAEQNRPPRKPRKKKPRWTLEQFPVDPVEGKSRFHDFSLSLGLMHAVADLGFQYCTPIQEKPCPMRWPGRISLPEQGPVPARARSFWLRSLPA